MHQVGGVEHLPEVDDKHGQDDDRQDGGAGHQGEGDELGGTGEDDGRHAQGDAKGQVQRVGHGAEHDAERKRRHDQGQGFQCAEPEQSCGCMHLRAR